MSWFKIDDQLHGHPKTRRAGMAALGLWAVAGSYSSAYKLDGHIDRGWVTTWPQGVKLAGVLCSANLWHASGHDCPDCPQPNDPKGWVFHDYFDVNPSADEIEKKREYDRERQRERRSARAFPRPKKEAT